MRSGASRHPPSHGECAAGLQHLIMHGISSGAYNPVFCSIRGRAEWSEVSYHDKNPRYTVRGDRPGLDAGRPPLPAHERSRRARRVLVPARAGHHAPEPVARRHRGAGEGRSRRDAGPQQLPAGTRVLRGRLPVHELLGRDAGRAVRPSTARAGSSTSPSRRRWGRRWKSSPRWTRACTVPPSSRCSQPLPDHQR